MINEHDEFEEDETYNQRTNASSNSQTNVSSTNSVPFNKLPPKTSPVYFSPIKNFQASKITSNIMSKVYLRPKDILNQRDTRWIAYPQQIQNCNFQNGSFLCSNKKVPPQPMPIKPIQFREKLYSKQTDRSIVLGTAMNLEISQLANKKISNKISVLKSCEQYRSSSVLSKKSPPTTASKQLNRTEYSSKDLFQKSYKLSKTPVQLKQNKIVKPQKSKTKKQEESDYLKYVSIPAIQLRKQVSAKYWSVVNADTGEQIAGRNENNQREVASITKIMTCYVALHLAERFQLSLEDTFFEVSYNGANIGGTSACLQEGDQISLKDLLFGMMLPSGNDAAVTIAENFGDYIDDEKDLDEEDYNALIDFKNKKKSPTLSRMDFFLSQMNLFANKFEMSKTTYANPHGLANDLNKSTASDIAKLCLQAIKNPVFSRIVGSKIYFAEIIDTDGYSKEIFWENTNKLLYKGYLGIKTGITNRAGPCVVEHYKDSFTNLIIVLLNSKSTEERWDDAEKIVDWIKENS